MADPDRTTPPTPTAAALRAAADLLGVRPLAIDHLRVKERTLYNWMQGKRTPPDSILREVRQILIVQRQKVGELIGAIRAIEDGRITGEAVGEAGGAD